MSCPSVLTRQKFNDAQLALGRSIRSRREAMSLSQEELGLRINADQAYVSRLERGLLNPTLESIVEVAAAMEITLKELFL